MRRNGESPTSLPQRNFEAYQISVGLAVANTTRLASVLTHIKRNMRSVAPATIDVHGREACRGGRRPAALPHFLKCRGFRTIRAPNVVHSAARGRLHRSCFVTKHPDPYLDPSFDTSVMHKTYMAGQSGLRSGCGEGAHVDSSGAIVQARRSTRTTPNRHRP